tara:strand:- start:131696 stop:133384 length:1689 start_codon:yes stop_codon:yes gene_type:complete
VQDSTSAELDLTNWRKYRGRMGEDARATPVYKMKLTGPAPTSLSLYPQNLRSGDASIGQEILKGRWRIGRDVLDIQPGTPPWDVPGPSRHFADRLHRFHWLTHLHAVGPEGQRFARTMIADWVEEFGRWNGFVWRFPVVVDRVWNWLGGGPQMLDNLAPDSEVLETLLRQGRHIQHAATDCPDPSIVLRSLFVQLVLAFSADEGERRIAALEGQIQFALDDQILADGGHISRNPLFLLDILLDLQTIDDLYLRTGRPSLPFISKFVPRIAGMLKFLRMGDGGLPIMNGSSEGNRADIKNALFPYAGSRAFAFATKSGIQKIEAGETRLMLDAGYAPSPEYGAAAHAGCLAIELEDHGERIVTNCGSHPDIGPEWQAATRRTDGHSTLILAGEDASQFNLARSLGVEAPSGPSGVTAKRMEEDGTIMIDAQHGGWKASHGLVFRRRVFMEPDGKRFTGEDSLFRPISAGMAENTDAIPFNIRFHLHPGVTMTPEGEHLKIALPSGASWLFKTKHKRKTIERSVYLARGRVEKCWQLVLAGDADPNGDASMDSNVVKWAFVKNE